MSGQDCGVLAVVCACYLDIYTVLSAIYATDEYLCRFASP